MLIFYEESERHLMSPSLGARVGGGGRGGRSSWDGQEQRWTRSLRFKLDEIGHKLKRTKMWWTNTVL